jgi:farnesyl-diphosphate farnesyltransferase
MSGNPGNDVLKQVSRSFYLSLRLLPRPMREAASLAYLLARTSDTLADTAKAPLEDRLFCLGEFGLALVGEREISRWPLRLLNAVEDVGERHLLEISDDLLAWLGRLPAGEAELVREVVGIIISGQKLDLGRFADAERETPVALEDDAALEDYAWRVAGCVGAFWTKLGFFTMGEGFSSVPASVLIEQGIAYGKGLQLVNILRDLPADLAMGRCYLPVADPLDSIFLLEAHGRWLERSNAWVNAGFTYAESLRSRRLRAATVLPAMIARETLERMRGADWKTLQTRVKVTRARVYLALVRAFMGKTQ